MGKINLDKLLASCVDISTYANTIHKDFSGGELRQLTLRPSQEYVLNMSGHEKVITWNCPRRLGKTYASIVWASYNAIFSPSTVVICVPSIILSEYQIKKIGYAMAYIEDVVGEQIIINTSVSQNIRRLEFFNGSTITFMTIASFLECRELNITHLFFDDVNMVLPHIRSKILSIYDKNLSSFMESAIFAGTMKLYDKYIDNSYDIKSNWYELEENDEVAEKVLIDLLGEIEFKYQYLLEDS